MLPRWQTSPVSVRMNRTLQTERYFQALKGLGAPVRMVILPKESHSYTAKDNILHLLWEQDQFLEKHLKGK